MLESTLSIFFVSFKQSNISINLFDLPGNDLLIRKGYKTKSLIEFPGH